MTTNRRSFLKGLSAALVVPSPVLWTPEERELVAGLPADVEPEIEGAPAPHGHVDYAGPVNHTGQVGWFMAVLPARLGTSFTNNGWEAVSGRVEMMELRQEISYMRTPTFGDAFERSVPMNYSWRMNAWLWPEFQRATGETPQQAARGIKLFQ